MNRDFFLLRTGATVSCSARAVSIWRIASNIIYRAEHQSINLIRGVI